MKIRRNYPAGRWGEAFPLGSGQIGAMIYGGKQEEWIDLSELTFFSGNKSETDNQPQAAEAFAKMREQALAEDFDRMTETAQKVIGVRNNYGTNLPVGRIVISRDGQERERDAYEAWLDIRDGVSYSGYEDESGRITSRAFVSHVDQALVYSMESTGKQNVKISFQSFRENETAGYTENTGSFYCQALENMHSDGTTGVRLRGNFQVLTDGILKPQKGSICVERAGYIYLILCMETDFEKQCLDGTTVCDRVEKAVKKGYDKLLKDHKQDLNALYDQSVLEIEKTGKEAVDLIPGMYQMGRYLLYSSSRGDSKLPAHLQGIWNDNVACRIGWTCDMHLDINTQMNYWPSEVTGLSETAEPLFKWIKETLVPSGKRTAKTTYGYPGWVAELVSNAWGFTAPYWAEPIAPCPTGGVWILTHMWEHYLTTQDIAFLENEAFPIIEEASAFFDAYVFEDGKGRLTCGPSISPENSFVKEGKVYHNSIGCTYEILMIRELFEIYMQACECLNCHTDLEKRIKEKRKRLLPYRISGDGTIAEWSHDYPAADPQHRHTSHLLGLFPFAQITPEAEELAEAAEKTIEKKLTPAENWEDTGWARSMLMLYEARLRRPEKAWHHIRAMLGKLREPNGMIIHPPTRGAGSFDNVYELDGNTGLTACIAEMLMQSHKGVIRILPCRPKEWMQGRVTGLHARGGIVIDLEWGNGKCTAVLFSARKCSCLVQCGKSETVKAELKAGKPAVYEWETDQEG